MRFILCVFMFFCLAIGVYNSALSQGFDPITEVDYFKFYGFKIDPIWFETSGIDTSGWLRITIPETLVVHFIQPKRRSANQIKPYFCKHIDTLTAIINNDSSLFLYSDTGDDSAVFAQVSLEDVTPGLWQFSVSTTDTAGNTSELSEPFEAIIRQILYPGQPVLLKLILK